MSARITYTCDRCEMTAHVMVLEGVPVDYVPGWARVGLEAQPVVHLCSDCNLGLARYLDGVDLV